MAEHPKLDQTYQDLFNVGKFWWWYMPMNTYRQFATPSTGKERQFHVAFYYFVITSMVFLMIQEVIFIVYSISSGGDFVEWVTCIVWFICAINGYQTTVFAYNRGPQQIELLGLLHENFPTTDAEKQRIDCDAIVKAFIKKSTSIVYLFSAAFIGMIMSPLVISVVIYFTTGEVVLELPLDIWFPFDAAAMPWYPFMYLFELWYFALETFIILGTATHLGGISKVIGIHFRILAVDAREMDFTGEVKHDMKVIGAIIKRHNRALYASQTARDLFSFQLLVAFTVASLVICIFMFLMYYETELVVQLTYVLVLVCYLNYSSLYAIIGDELIESSLAISDAVYDSNWTITDVRVQQLIVLIIQRANEPEVFSGMGFFEASYPTMSKIMTTSYSYFTLMSATFEE